MKAISKIKFPLILGIFFFWMSCEDFLDTEPYGTTSFEQLSSLVKGAETILIAAYSNLDGYSMATSAPWAGAASNWVFASIAGGDAYKGSDDTDQTPITQIELHSTLTTNNDYLSTKWATYYQGITRANDAIKAFQGLKKDNEDLCNLRIGEARFLRGFYHFELYKIFGIVPYLDETVLDVRIGKSADVLEKIQEDFMAASEALPIFQEQNGRITKGAAQSYLGITYMWQKDFDRAKAQFDIVIESGRYELNAKYHENFNAEYRTSTSYINKESILEVEQSVNDGADGENGSMGDVLNYPIAIMCCGFHQPSQNLVNAFKTDGNGLPMLETYNDEDVPSDDKLEPTDPFIPYSGNLDPRLDWTVGRRDIPYLDWGFHGGREWVRGDKVYNGPYSPKKNVVYKAQVGSYTDMSSWTPGFSANNYKILRFGDVILYSAEAEIELGNLNRGLELINLVRTRAANPEGFVMNEGIPAANYFIKVYPSFANQEFARKAVHFERRLELGMEGHRFFDLVRWGVAAEERNKYFLEEKEKRTYLSAGSFVEGKNEIQPIPQRAIDLSYKDGVPTLGQNPGYD